MDIGIRLRPIKLHRQRPALRSRSREASRWPSEGARSPRGAWVVSAHFNEQWD